MTDYTELKRLAESAPEGPWFGPEYAPGTSYVFDVDLGTLLEYQSIDSEKDACLRYVAAANPAVVLALIAENERLKTLRSTTERDLAQELEVWRHGPSCWNCGDTGDVHDMVGEWRGQCDCNAAKLIDAVSEREELKAENEALRKDAGRYEWICANACDLNFYAAGPAPIRGRVEIDVEQYPVSEWGSAKPELDSIIDAAMGKGEQS